MSIFGETNTIIDDIEPSVLDNDTDQVLSNDTDQVLSNVLEKKKPGKKKNNV